MSRMESFEKIWAERHGVPLEAMAQYRFTTKEGYRLPDMASHYRTHCAALDMMLREMTEAMDMRLQLKRISETATDE